jgi:uncharacterized protein (TIGR02588 family)
MTQARESRSPAAAKDAAQGPARIEWIVAMLGAIMVLGAVAHLVHTALGRDRSPPDVELAVVQTIELDSGYLVRFRARNQGGTAAESVQVGSELAMPDGAVETRRALLPELPPRSDREGGLVFEHDPRVGRLRLHVEGFAIP